MNDARIVLETFSPEMTVSLPQLFAGRVRAVESLAESLFDSGSIPIIYGHRGVGKSSLAEQFSLVARGGTELLGRMGFADSYALNEDEYYNVLFVDGGQVQSLEGLEDLVSNHIANLARQIAPPPTRREVKRTTTIGMNVKALSTQTAIEYEARPGEKLEKSPLLVEAEKYAQLRDARRLLVILDEFDRFPKDQHLASWLHSQNPIGVKFALCGIAMDYHELLDLHPSLERRLRPVHVPRMDNDELDELLDLAIAQMASRGLNLSIEPAARSRMLNLATGLPWFMQYLGRESFKQVVRRGATMVTDSDVDYASNFLVHERLAQKFEGQYLTVVAMGSAAERAVRYVANNSDRARSAVRLELLRDYLITLHSREDAEEQVSRLATAGLLQVLRGLAGDVLVAIDPSFGVYCRNRPSSIPPEPGYQRSDLTMGEFDSRWARQPAGYLEHRHSLGRASTLATGPIAKEYANISTARELVAVDVAARYALARGRRVSTRIFTIPGNIQWAEGRVVDPQRAARSYSRLGLSDLLDSSLDLSSIEVGGSMHAILSRLKESGSLYLESRGRAMCAISGGILREDHCDSHWGDESPCEIAFLPARPGRWRLASGGKKLDVRIAGSKGIQASLQHRAAQVASDDMVVASPNAVGPAVSINDDLQCECPPGDRSQSRDGSIDAREVIDAICDNCGLAVPSSFYGPFVYALALLSAGDGARDTRSAAGQLPPWLNLEYFANEAILIEAIVYARAIQACLYEKTKSRESISMPSRAFRVAPIQLAGRHMSKSRGSFVDLDAILDSEGADVVRLTLMWTTRLDATMEWSQGDLPGIRRFLRRLWSIEIRANLPPEESLRMDLLAREVASEVASEIEGRRFHRTRTPIQRLVSSLSKTGASPSAWATSLAIIAPLCPVLVRELMDRSSMGAEVPSWPTE